MLGLQTFKKHIYLQRNCYGCYNCVEAKKDIVDLRIFGSLQYVRNMFGKKQDAFPIIC